MTFDPENRLTTDAALQTNAYSGDGLRAWKQTGTTTSTRTYFLYDGDTPVMEETSTGAFLAANTYGADGLVSSRRSGPGTICYLYDERGNVSQRTSSTGAVTGSDLYDAYGARTGTAAQADPFGYGAQAGYYTDLETGLILCTHRFYDPSNGRWLTRDPMGYAGGVNLYGYVGNDPVNKQDATGFIPSSLYHPPPQQPTIGQWLYMKAGCTLYDLRKWWQGPPIAPVPPNAPLPFVPYPTYNPPNRYDPTGGNQYGVGNPIPVAPSPYRGAGR